MAKRIVEATSEAYSLKDWKFTVLTTTKFKVQTTIEVYFPKLPSKVFLTTFDKINGTVEKGEIELSWEMKWDNQNEGMKLVVRNYRDYIMNCEERFSENIIGDFRGKLIKYRGEMWKFQTEVEKTLLSTFF